MSHQAALAVAVLLLAGGATAIIICITVLAGRPLREVVATMPLLAEQWVTLDAPGDYILHGENAGFSLIFVGRAYSLQAADGTEARGFRWVTRNHSYGIPLWRFHVEAAGRYYLRVSRLPGDRDLTPYQLNVARVLPFRSWSVVGAMAVSAFVLMAGLVMLMA